MSDCLLLKLEAPLMAFGGSLVDQHGVSRQFPAVSMLAGLLGNALGYEHSDDEALQQLQSRIRFAARLDRPGLALVDYHTVDLGQPFMKECGWTTRGRLEKRGGGSAKEGTHIRRRHYLADAVCVVALRLEPADLAPTLVDVARALDEPVRPLFLGRKCCLPSGLLVGRTVQAASLVEALAGTAGDGDSVAGHELDAQWPEGETAKAVAGSRVVVLTDERDWSNQVHVGERLVRQGTIRVSGGES